MNRKSLLASLIMTFFLWNSCTEDSPDKIETYAIDGFVQKGPYILGTSISISELTSSLEQTGKIFSTEIKDNSGSFAIEEIALTSGYISLSANGYYFNEVSGIVSNGVLNLNALAFLTSASQVNLNVLTHLEKPRVEMLMEQGETFDSAKQIAQREVLSIFGVNGVNASMSEQLNIVGEGEGDAELLAISVILQADRSVGELSELLAQITNDIKTDGVLDDKTIITDLRQSAIALNLNDIRENLLARYQALDITASIPVFEQVVENFLVLTGEAATVQLLPATNVTESQARLNGVANAGSLTTTITFQYGTTDAYESEKVMQNTLSGQAPMPVSVDLTGLLPGQLYHFRIKAENPEGIVYSNDLTFTTLGAAPVAFISDATLITTSTAMLNGAVDPSLLTTAVFFEYGTTTAYGQTTNATPETVTGSTKTNISAAITGLLPGTNYHYRVRGQNVLGQSQSEDMSFVTLGKVPTLTNTAPTDVSTTGITINASVNANHFKTAVTIEYGTTIALGQTMTATPGTITGNSSTNIAATLTELLPGSQYHYRVKGENEMGIAYSAGSTFITLGAIPIVTTGIPTNVNTDGITIQASVNANHLLTTVMIEYGTTSALGQTMTATPGTVTGNSPINISATLTGLLPGSLYHYRVKGENELGVAYSATSTFVTLGAIPFLTTGTPTNVNTDRITIQASVNANHLPTTVTVEYGASTSYGSSVSISNEVSGSTLTNVSILLTGLTFSQTYHYRVKAVNELGTTVGEDNVFLPFHPVGSDYLGGKLAYVLKPADPGYDPNTPHGIIVTSSDINGPGFSSSWDGSNSQVPPILVGGTSTAIGKGSSNTDKMVSVFGDGDYYAASICSNYSINGYDDWFLPSLNELKIISLNRVVLDMNGFGYWSSSEFNTSDAWEVRPNTGEAVNSLKSIGWWVRAARYF